MQNEKLLLQSPLGDINIMVSFMLHCSGNNILINTGHGNTRKIIENSCPVLSKIEYKGLSGKYMLFARNNYISSIFRKGKKK